MFQEALAVFTFLMSFIFTQIQATNYDICPSVSANGARVVFMAWQTETLYLADVSSTIVPEQITHERSSCARISGDGNYIVFSTTAALVLQDPDSLEDVYRMDLQTRQVSLVSSTDSPAFNQAFAARSGRISYGGRYVLFTATNPSEAPQGPPNTFNTEVFWKDMDTGEIRLISRPTNGSLADGPSYADNISADGTRIVFSSYTSNMTEGLNGVTSRVFLATLQPASQNIMLVSKSLDGNDAGKFSLNSDITDAGDYIVFASNVSTLVPEDTNEAFDIFLYDTNTNILQSITQGQYSNVQMPDISANGEFITFLGSYLDSQEGFVYTRQSGSLVVAIPEEATASKSDDLSIANTGVIVMGRGTASNPPSNLEVWYGKPANVTIFLPIAR